MTRRREDPSGLLERSTPRDALQLLGTARAALFDALDAIPAGQRTARRLVAHAGAMTETAGEVVLRSTSPAPGSSAPPSLDPSPSTERDTRNPSPATP